MVQHCFGPIPTLEFVQSQMIWPCLTQKLQIHQLLCLPKSAHFLYSDIYQPLLRRGQIICFYTNSNAEIGPKQCQTSGLLRYFFLLQCIFARSVYEYFCQRPKKYNLLSQIFLIDSGLLPEMALLIELQSNSEIGEKATVFNEHKRWMEYKIGESIGCHSNLWIWEVG